MATVYRDEEKETRTGKKKARIISDPGFPIKRGSEEPV